MKISKEVLEKVVIAMTILAKAVQEHINNKENKRGEWNGMGEVFYCSQCGEELTEENVYFMEDEVYCLELLWGINRYLCRVWRKNLHQWKRRYRGHSSMFSVLLSLLHKM